METVVETIRIGPVALELERPRDPEALLDEDAFAHDEFLPYWAQPWPSGLALATRVPGMPLRHAVLELGCGLGLPSLVAAAHGASVTALDWSPDAVALLRRNALRNGLDVEAVVGDWRDARLLGDRRFGLVLAADVLYEERNAEPLLAQLERLLAPGGTAVVADPGRRHADAFLDAVRARGWSTRLSHDERIPSGAVVELTRGEARL
jgi:predicted nicotinamide N-methyase